MLSSTNFPCSKCASTKTGEYEVVGERSGRNTREYWVEQKNHNQKIFNSPNGFCLVVTFKFFFKISQTPFFFEELVPLLMILRFTAQSRCALNYYYYWVSFEPQIRCFSCFWLSQRLFWLLYASSFECVPLHLMHDCKLFTGLLVLQNLVVECSFTIINS